VTEAIALYTRKHARGCVRRASGLVLTRYSYEAQDHGDWPQVPL